MLDIFAWQEKSSVALVAQEKFSEPREVEVAVYLANFIYEYDCAV